MGRRALVRGYRGLCCWLPHYVRWQHILLKLATCWPLVCLFQVAGYRQLPGRECTLVMWPVTVQLCLRKGEKKCHQHGEGIVSENFYDIADTELSMY